MEARVALVTRDYEQPGERLSRRRAVQQRAVRGEEDLLRRVLGLSLVAQERAAESRHGRSVLAVERASVSCDVPLLSIAGSPMATPGSTAGRPLRIAVGRTLGQTACVPVEALKAMGADVEGALEHVNVPSYVIDRAGVVRWMNEAAREAVGDRIGRQFTSVVAPEDTRRARELFVRKILGNTQVTDAPVVVVDSDGGRVAVEISSVPLRQGEHVVGVFGQVTNVLEEPHAHPELHLTPRQSEVLKLLELGRSTPQMAEELHVSRETVRNHVRHLLHALGASSRLEAVAVARGDLVGAAR